MSNDSIQFMEPASIPSHTHTGNRQYLNLFILQLSTPTKQERSYHFDNTINTDSILLQV